MRKRAIRTALAGLLLVLFLFVCGCDWVGLSREDSGPVTKTGLQVQLSTEPQQPLAEQPTDVSVQVSLLGKPITHAQVILALQQGANALPSSKSLELQETKAGEYSGTAVFPSAGLWIVQVRAEDNGQVQTASVKVDVK